MLRQFWCSIDLFQNQDSFEMDIFSPFSKVYDCSNFTPIRSPIAINSSILTVSRLSFLAKFWGVWPRRLASSAMLMFFSLHNSFIKLDVLILHLFYNFPQCPGNDNFTVSYYKPNGWWTQYKCFSTIQNVSRVEPGRIRSLMYFLSSCKQCDTYTSNPISREMLPSSKLLITYQECNHCSDSS